MYSTNQTEKVYGPHAKVPFPNVSITLEEQKKLEVLLVDLTTYVDQMAAKFITGQEPFSKWDDYVQTIKKMKYDEVVKIYQDAYDRWKKSAK